MKVCFTLYLILSIKFIYQYESFLLLYVGSMFKCCQITNVFEVLCEFFCFLWSKIPAKFRSASSAICFIGRDAEVWRCCVTYSRPHSKQIAEAALRSEYSISTFYPTLNLELCCLANHHKIHESREQRTFFNALVTCICLGADYTNQDRN